MSHPFYILHATNLYTVRISQQPSTFILINVVCSKQQAGEARRQLELEEKRRKLKEKISSDDNEQSGTAAMKKKIQAESNTRMAQHNVPLGLPKSLTVRDDPLTKAQAFLTEMPNLD